MKKKQQSNRIFNNNTGITLIALVVTIVVLIILATISINLVMNSNIIGRAEKTSGIQERATELERLELIKGSVAIDYKGKVTVDNYMKVAIKDGVVEGVSTPEELEAKNEDGSQDFVTDKGWGVNVAPDSENPNNVIITIEGEKGKLPPRITKINISATKTSITAKAKVRHLSGGTIEYYYKLSSAADSAYTEIDNVTNDGATIAGLTEGEKYDIKAVATNQNGTAEMVEKEIIARDFVAVEKITLNKNKFIVGINDLSLRELKLTAIVEPENATIEKLKWTTDDDGVATVNESGNITGKALGTTIITAEATDGVNTVKATCSIKINKTETIMDPNDNKIVVPGGFEIVEHGVGNVEYNYSSNHKPCVQDGVVIQDDEENQFVWIPMASESDFPTNSLEPYENGYFDERADYDTMKRQVLKHGGFYIGRYEAGVDTTTIRTEETEAQKVVCKAGVAPYDFVKWGDSMDDIGSNGAVFLAKRMYADRISVTSSLCYRCQWDAMCTFIEDSDRKSIKKSDVELTGNNLSDVSKNIYDLAGNCCELLMLAWDDENRTACGGDYSRDDTTIADIPYKNPLPYVYKGCSFRVTLYIKD